MAKLNLKALQGTTNTENKVREEPSQLTSQEQLEAQNQASEKAKEPAIVKLNIPVGEKKEVVSEKTEISEKTDDTSKKKKISLRGFSKPSLNEVEVAPVQEETPSIISEEVAPVQEETPSIISEEVAPVQEETPNTVAIMDGDTNCAIIKDDSFEIFGSYKGSFTKEEEKKEEPKKAIEEKTMEENIINVVTPEEIIPLTSIINDESKNENKNKDENAISTPIVQATQDETTPLEKMTEKRKINKKVMYSSLVSVLCVAVFGIVFMNNDFMKTSVPDIKNIPSENTIVENTIPSPDITQEDGGNINTPTSENSTTPVENTNQIANNEIVKENDSNSVDNNDNNRKINKKVESFLLKKYKIK